MVATLAFVGPAGADASNTSGTSAPPGQSRPALIDDADPGWTWSGMVPYADLGLAKGTGHAGGPGSYGVYTFDGTAVDVYVMRGSSVNIDGRSHKIGRIKISIDGHVKADIPLGASAPDFNYGAYSVTGLPSKFHVLQVEPDAGWVVIDYIKVSADEGGSPPAKAGSPPAEPGLLFSSKYTPLSAKDSVDSRGNVAGFNPDIGPELQLGVLPADWGLSTIYAHSGDSALRYSGSSSGGEAYCYMYAYTASIAVASNTWLGYWILPQQDNGRYVGIDLHCTDGTTLSSTGAVDTAGVPMAPSAGHGGAIPLYAWSQVRCNIGQWLAGKTIDKIWIGYARNGAAGQYRGYIDDFVIANEQSAKP